MGTLLGEPGGGAPLLDTLKDTSKRIWRQASLSVGALLGNLEGDFMRWMKGAPGVEHLSLRGLGRGAPLLGTFEDMQRKAPDMGISHHRGPFMAEGNLEGGLYTRDFER